MKAAQILALAVSAIIAYDGYTNKKEGNDVSPVIPPNDLIIDVQIADEQYDAPSDADLLKIVSPITDVLITEPDDALTVARVFHQWASLLGSSSELNTTQEFQQAYQEANRILVTHYFPPGKYAGKLNEHLNGAIEHSFKKRNLTGPDGNVMPGPWNAECKAAAEEAFNAIAFAAFDAFARANIPSNAR